MKKMSPDGDYTIEGDKNALFTGLNGALTRYINGLFFVIADDSWPEKSKKRQFAVGSVEKLVKKAVSRGFNGFIVPVEHKEIIESVSGVRSIVVVSDTWPFFLNAAEYIREVSGCKVFAVTGSAGKTSTCAMLELALRERYGDHLYSAEGVNNNFFRDSVSSLSRLYGYEAAILEVSASKRFIKSDFSISPDVSIFTNLSQAHTEYLGSVNDIAVIKSTLFNKMPVDGRIVLNVDMPCSDIVYEIAKMKVDNVITYGEADAADVKLVSYDLKNGKAEVSYFGRNVVFSTKLQSKHMLLNSIAVMTALCNTPDDLKKVSNNLLTFSTPKGRGSTHEANLKGKTFTIIDESYNSNLASLKASLDSLSNFEPSLSGKRFAVIGDMLELGDASEEIHKSLAALINGSSADKVILVGQEVAQAWKEISLSKKIALLPDTKDLLTLLGKNISQGDVVLFKASNSIGFGKVVGGLIKR